jgi:DsbC/DsbD-like thiol-disulfide interchange protein
MRLLLSGTLFIIACFPISLLLADEPQPAQLQLICEKDGIVPGQTFYLGLHIKHDKGWHTYWKNPGDVGLPPSIKWDLPKGFIAHPFQWASPGLHKMGIIDVQAFHGEITHIIPMEAPANLKTGMKIKLLGHASWLMCSKNCIPGNKDLSITLQVVKHAKISSRWKKQFAATREGLPKAVKGWNISAKTVGEYIEMLIQPGTKQIPLPHPYFFCDANHITTQEKPEYLPDGRDLVIRMRKTEWAPKKISRLTGHLHSKKGWDSQGKIHNMEVDIPLDESK